MFNTLRMLYRGVKIRGIYTSVIISQLPISDWILIYFSREYYGETDGWKNSSTSSLYPSDP